MISLFIFTIGGIIGEETENADKTIKLWFVNLAIDGEVDNLKRLSKSLLSTLGTMIQPFISHLEKL